MRILLITVLGFFLILMTQGDGLAWDQGSGSSAWETDERSGPLYPARPPSARKSKRRPGEVRLERITGMAFVWVPGGCFSPVENAKRKKAQRSEKKVCTSGFWIGQHEVTQGLWTRMMTENPSRFQGRDLPVEQVSHEKAQAFIRRLNQATGLVFSLPTASQWTVACSGYDNAQQYPWGEETFRPQANCGGCDSGGFQGKTAPVGSFPPNSLGIYDLGGNVREWCLDDPGNRATDRPVKGGSFVDGSGRAGCGAEDRLLPGVSAYYLGFRLVVLERN